MDARSRDAGGEGTSARHPYALRGYGVHGHVTAPDLAARLAIVLVCALAATHAAASDASPAPSSAPSTSRVGELAGDRVRIRTGPSLNHFALGVLSRGQPIIVRREIGDWYEIDVPSWVPIYVHAAYVEFPDGAPEPLPSTVAARIEAPAEDAGEAGASPSGESVGSRIHFRPTRGRIVADRLVVRAVPARRHEPIGTLTRGADVIVLGRSGDWLRVRSPIDASAWIHRSLVRITADLRPGQLAALRAALGPETRLSDMRAHVFARAEANPGVDGAADSVAIPAADQAALQVRDAAAAPEPSSAEPGASSATPAGGVVTADSLVGETWRRLKDLLRSPPARDGEPGAAVAASMREIRSDFERVLETGRGDDPEVSSARERAGEGLRLLGLLEERADAIRDARRILEELNDAERELRLRLARQKKTTTRKGTVGTQNIQSGRRQRFSETGRLARVGAAPGRQGTHLLRMNGKVLCLLRASPNGEPGDTDTDDTDRSDADDRGRRPLDAFLDENVRVQGVVVGLDESSGLKLVEVSNVKRVIGR